MGDLVALRRRFPFLPARAGQIVSTLPRGLSAAGVLARLRGGPLRARDELVGSANRAGGSGGRSGRFLEIGEWFLKASLQRRYPDPQTALECEGNAELERQGSALYHPLRAWFLSHGADGAFWACSLTPTLPTLRERLNGAPGDGPDGEGWELYLDAFRLTFEALRRHALLLDCNPNNFGIGSDRLYYVDDDLVPRPGRIPFGHQLLLRLREYEGSPLPDRLRFVRRFGEVAEAYADDAELLSWLLQDLEPRITWPEAPELRDALEALLRRLRGAGEPR